MLMHVNDKFSKFQCTYEMRGLDLFSRSVSNEQKFRDCAILR